MKKNQLFMIFLVVVLLLVAVLFLGKFINKNESPKVTSAEVEPEQPKESPSGFSFSPDEKVKLMSEMDQLYVLGNKTVKVNWEAKTLEESNFIEKIYEQDGLSYGLDDGKLYLLGKDTSSPLAEGILESRPYKTKLLYRSNRGISLFHYDKKISQLLMENVEGEEPLKLENTSLIDGGKYFSYYRDASNVTEIHLTETLEHVSNFDGKISSASWTSDSFLFEDMENLNRVGYYNISSEEISKFSLTTDNEKVLYSPKFDEQGMIRYLTEKEGKIQLNKLDVQTQLVKKISTASRADFVKEDKLQGHYVLQFKDRFYYSENDVDYNFYILPNEFIGFTKNSICVTQGDTLKVIQGDSFKSYSLKGKPLTTLATDTAFYYTFLHEGKQWLDKINIQG